VNLDTGNTAIVLDSTADFPEAPALFKHARVVPLYVNFDGQSYRDGIDIQPDAFYARLGAAPTLPTTSQPTPGDFLAVYEELADRYERILSLQLSSTFSGTFASAQAAAAQLDGDRVRVIDTRAVSVTIAMLALAIERRLERGTTDEEIDALIARYGAEHRLLFTVDTLEYLAKGGRIGRAAAFAGNLLNVKPMLTIRDGEVVPLKRVRGSRKAFEEFAATLESESRDVPGLRVGLAHAAAPERLEALRKLVREVRPQAEIEIATSLGAVIGAHAGPGTVALFWFEDTE
jgi:DegV family protein with EDD domain